MWNVDPITNKAAITFPIILMGTLIFLVITTSTLHYHDNVVKAVSTNSTENRTAAVVSGLGATAAVNASNIISVSKGIASNISNSSNFIKLGEIDVKTVSNLAKLSVAQKPINETTNETVVPTRAGYNDTRAYLTAKVGASKSITFKEQTLFTFSPLSSSPPLISTAAATPEIARNLNSTATMTSPNDNSNVTQQFVKVNKVLNGTLDIETGCPVLKCTPPDDQLGVGPNHVVQMVNLAGKIWNKNDSNSIQYFALKDFFMTGGDQISDPYIIWDATSGKWFASLFDVASGSYHIAVSKSEDPTTSWIIYDLRTFATCPDQGRFSVNKDLFVIGVNDFHKGCSDGFIGAQYTIAAKNDMINGSQTIRSQTEPPNPSIFSVLPVQPLSSNPTLFMVTVGDFQTDFVQLYSITGIPPNATVVSNVIPIKHATAPPPTTAKQPPLPNGEESLMLDTGDGRVSTASYRDGKIWLAFNDQCQAQKSCIRLIQLDTNDLKKPLQDFDLAAKEGADVFYPVLSTDVAGNMIMFFGISSHSIHPSVMVTGQRAISDPNTLAQPIFLVKGSVNENSGRYGDYDGIAIDSNTNIWVSHEYNKIQSGWSTFIASLSRQPG
jgi:hypothetical protein